jgi:hypothetical protein
MWKARRCETQTYRHRTHCRYNRVEGVAAYGRAALRWRRTIGRQRRLRMRYSMASPSSATQGRCNSVAVAGLDSRRWWRDGSVLSPARVHVRTVSRLSACHEPKQLLDSRCGNRGMDSGMDCVPALHASHGSNLVGETSESFGPWLRLCCCQARGRPGQGSWRGEGICSVFRMNPVLADHLRAHSAEVRGGRVCRG